MKYTSKYVVIIMLGTLLFLPALACGIGAKPDLDATVQAALAATQGAQATETSMAASVETAVAATVEAKALPEEKPQAQTGEVIASGAVEIFVPPETQGQQPPITVKAVSEPLPPAPEGSTSVSEAYEITSEGELAGPVLITLSYDPAELPSGAKEENLYIATKVGDGWEAVPDGFVDTAHHTVSASVTHFSIFGIFESAAEAVYDAVEAAIGDEITSEYFGDLPDGIRYDIYDKRIKPQDVTAVVHAKLSLATKAASGVISFANLVSKTAGMAIGAKESPEALAVAMGEAVIAEGGGEVGSFAVMMYDSASLGKELGTFLADTSQGNPQLLAAKAAAWVLMMEMEYINANMDKAFADLWKFNPTSVSRLQVYAVYIDAEPWLEGLGIGAKGVKFYYYDEGQGEWINYHDDMVYWKVEFEPTEEVAESPAPAPTSTPVPAAAPTPTQVPPTPTREPTSPPTRTATPAPTATPVRPTSGTIYIAPDGSGDYPTIQEAIDAVVPGSTILLDAGTYRLAWGLRISKSLSLIGAGMDLTEIVCESSGLAHFSGKGPFIIEDVTFRYEGGGQSSGSVYVDGGEVAFNRCRFDRAGLEFKGTTTGFVKNCEVMEGSDGIRVEDQTQITLEGNICTDNLQHGIVFRDSTGGVARGNECSRNGAFGILVEDQAAPTLEENRCNDNRQFGVNYVGYGGGVARRNQFSRNEIGIRVVQDAQVTLLEGNICTDNETYGIYYADQTGGVVRQNECSGNKWGIYVSEPADPSLSNNYCHGNLEGDIYDWRD